MPSALICGLLATMADSYEKVRMETVIFLVRNLPKDHMADLTEKLDEAGL